ncbi:hypothetical protein Tco_0835606 [Tanacetum coccineum]
MNQNRTVFYIDEETDAFYLQKAVEYHEWLIQQEAQPRLTRTPIFRDREDAERRLRADYFDDHYDLAHRSSNVVNGVHILMGITWLWDLPLKCGQVSSNISRLQLIPKSYVTLNSVKKCTGKMSESCLSVFSNVVNGDLDSTRAGRVHGGERTGVANHVGTIYKRQRIDVRWEDLEWSINKILEREARE